MRSVVNKTSRDRVRQEQAAGSRVFVKVRNGLRVDGAMADNLSMNGMDALMHDTSGHAVGNHVEVFNDKLGYVAGYVRSVRTRRIGIEFDTNTNNYAKIAAFFRNYRG